MKARSLFRGLRIAACVGALLIGLAWGTMALLEHSKLKGVEARIQAEGLASSLEDIVPPRVSLEDNAAPLMQEVSAPLKKLKDSIPEAGLLGSGNKEKDPAFFSENKLNELRARMASREVQSTLDLLRKASAKPACQFERDYTQGLGIDTKDLAAALYGAQLLRLSSWLRAREGDAAGAFGDLRAITGLAGFCLEDPLLINWLVGVAVENIGFRAAAEIVAAFPPGQIPMDQIRNLQSLWSARNLESRETLARKLDAERVIHTDWVRRNVYPDRFLNHPIYPFILMDRRVYPESMLALRERILTKQPAELPVDDEDLGQVSRFAITSYLALGAVGGYRRTLDEYQTGLQVAQVGVALEDWRGRHADYPDELEQLGLPPDMITDPFSGQSLGYNRTPEGATVYSVGSDRTSNGGNRRKKGQTGDVVWSVQRSAP